VDVTTHLRGRAIQAGAFLALVTGLVAGVQTAALADSPTLEVSAPSSGNSGATVTVQYTVGNPGSSNGGGNGEGAAGNVDVIVETSATGGNCNGCGRSTDPLGTGDSKTHTVQVTLPNVGQGQEQPVTFQVTATANGSPPTSKSVTITAKGPEAPQTVRQVSGKVKDNQGKRLAGAAVGMRDSQGHQYSVTTDAEGQFAFTSSDAQPISPGSITVGAKLDGYKAASTTVTGRANKSAVATITLKSLASASASPSASTSVSASATPADEATDDEALTDDTTTGPANSLAADPKNTSEDSGGISWLLLTMGGLLVAAGVGAMVLVWLRRKNAANNDDSDGGAGFGGGPIGGPTGPTRYGAADATRVAAPVGAGRGNDATMVAGAGMGAAGLSDAPTMIHRGAPIEDEFPDPYGAPIPPNGGFVGTGGNQWDNQGGYDGGGEYGGGAGAYGAQQGGYDNGQQRYDEHTSMYQPEQPPQPQPQPQQRYDEHTNLYQPNSGGYDEHDGYGGGNYGAGYDQGAAVQGGYEQGQAGYGTPGYDQPDGSYAGGYDQGGYDQAQAGYDQGQGYGQAQQQPGYDQRGGNYGNQGGYEQRGGAYGQDPNRRNRDWEE
jgi:hypothetical protein